MASQEWTIEMYGADIVALLVTVVIAQVAVIICLLAHNRHIAGKYRKNEELLDTVVQEQRPQASQGQQLPHGPQPQAVSNVYMAQNLKSEVFHTSLECSYLDRSTARTIHICPRCE